MEYLSANLLIKKENSYLHCIPYSSGFKSHAQRQTERNKKKKQRDIIMIEGRKGWRLFQTEGRYCTKVWASRCGFCAVTARLEVSYRSGTLMVVLVGRPTSNSSYNLIEIQKREPLLRFKDVAVVLY